MGTLSSPAMAVSIVGREGELAALREALDDAWAGHGRLVLLGGAAGIGKTTLAEGLCHEALALGAMVLIGRAYDLSETPPYGPWVEAFARAPHSEDAPPLPVTLAGGDVSPTATNQAALFREVCHYLRVLVLRRPTVLLLEDLHWADGATLDLLRVVARDLAELALLILVTYRADELVREHPLAVLLPALVRESHARRLALRPLLPEEVHALAGSRYTLHPPDETRLVAYLQARAEGNPLFIGELLRTLEEEGVLRPEGDLWRLGQPGSEVPPLLSHVIDARAARLGEGPRDLLLVAAALGQEVPLALWSVVSGVEETLLLEVAERAIKARLLTATADGRAVRFAHALIREALYERLGVLRRPQWHRRAAEALIAAQHPDPDTVAYHLRQAGDPRAIEWLIRAGLRARAAAVWLGAADRFDDAAALLAGDDERRRERGWLLFYCGRLHYFSDTARTLRYFEVAERLALLVVDRVLLAYLRSTRGLVRCYRGEIRQGVAEVEHGVAELEALPGEYHLQTGEDAALNVIGAMLPDSERAVYAAPAALRTTTLLHANIVNWYGWTGRYREALAGSAAIIDRVTAVLGEDALRHVAAAYLGLGHGHAGLGHPAEARHAYARARAGHYASGDAFMVECTIWIELLLVILPYCTEDTAERERLVAEAARAWARAETTITATPHGSPAALLLALVEGRWTEARRLAEEGRTASTSNYMQGASVALGFLARHQGDPDAAWTQVRLLHPAGPGTAPGGCHFAHGIALQALAAELALDAGDLPLAADWIAAHRCWLAWSGATLWWAEHHLLQARHARLGGAHVAALRHAGDALACAATPRQPLALLAAHRALGELAGAAGDVAAATAHLDVALALAGACAAPYERALTFLALAELRALLGERALALRLLDDARSLLTPLGARPALARAATIAARLDTPPLLAAPLVAAPDGLSPREAEVLTLLAAGRSNHEIARALTISPRTVQRHVANAYLKIGAHNKANATAYALQHHLA
jgi:DNA-binding CsgD family transcriptional regulator